MKHPISGTDTDASAEDIADLWPEMWANMGGLPEDEPDRRTVAAWFAAGECPPERLADANEQLGALLGWTIFRPITTAGGEGRVRRSRRRLARHNRGDYC